MAGEAKTTEPRPPRRMPSLGDREALAEMASQYAQASVELRMAQQVVGMLTAKIAEQEEELRKFKAESETEPEKKED